MDDNLSLGTVVAETLAYERLPDFEVYRTACWAVGDTIKHVEPAAGVRVNPERYA